MKFVVNSTDSYRADIDGLRCIAVMGVVIFHAFPQRLPGGFVGVDVFFVISGYLITGIIERALQSGHSVLLEFYRRRIRRIFPALITVLAATLIAGFFFLLAGDFALLGKHVAAGAGFVSNLVFWSEASYFDTSAATKPLQHLWSLGVEEQFYAFWPILMIMFYRIRRGLMLPIVLIAMISFAFSVQQVAVNPTAAFYSPATRLWELLAGAGLVTAERSGWRPPAFLLEPLAFVGLLLIAFSAAVLNSVKPFPGLWALPAVAGTVMVLAAGSNTWINRNLLSNRPAVTVGLFSYPLYLWHWPLLSMAFVWNFQQIPSGKIRFALVGISIVLAWSTYRFIEQVPKLRRHYTPLKLGAAMVAILLIGLAVYLSHGFPQRAVNYDERRQFVAQYDILHRDGLATAYRSECDFVKWGTLTEKDTINPSCTERTSGPYVMLWGDSHAQALSTGIADLLGPIPLHQVATSGCRPDTKIQTRDYINPAMKDACDRSNRYALEVVSHEKPDLVIIAQAGGHLDQDWEKFAQILRKLGARRVLLVGPLPQWAPSLPLVITARHWPYRGERVKDGLDQGTLDADASLTRQSKTWTSLDYVSLIHRLCNSEGCVAQVPNQRIGTLTAVDYAHLSPLGSKYVAATALSSALDRILKAASPPPPKAFEVKGSDPPRALLFQP